MTIYQALLILTATFACMISNISAEPAESKDLDARIENYLASFKTPINFWGKVVDQDGESIEGAKVTIYVLDKPGWGDDGSNTGTYTLTSDKNGRFELLNKRGASLGVQASADGYARAYDSESEEGLYNDSFSYSNEKAKSYARRPTREKPCVLVLRKKGEIADLKELKTQKVKIPKDGTSIAVDVQGSPIVLNVRCWSTAPDPFTYDRYDWRAEIRVEGGELQPVVDKHSVMAPAEGYHQAIQVDMSANKAKDWYRSSLPSQANLWARLSDGTHAKLEVKVITGREHAVMTKGWLNLDGGSSFEQ